MQGEIEFWPQISEYLQYGLPYNVQKQYVHL